MVLIIDPQNAGISGNMMVGAFVDLGCDLNRIKQVMETVTIEFGGVKVDIRKINKRGIDSTFLDVKTIDINNHNNHSISYHDFIYKINSIHKVESQKKDSLFDFKIVDDVFNISRNVFEKIATCEAKIHGKSLEEIHFHEVGAADAVADVFGTVFAFCKLGFHKKEERVIGLPIALGGGTIDSRHGRIPIPAPVTIEMLSDENISSFGGPVNTEIATPTGVALYTELCNEFSDFQPMVKIEKVGYGAGNKDFDFPNVLRLIQAESGIKSQIIDVIETNVDHLSGEAIGYLFEKIMAEGARDIAVIPVIMKKNRPGHILKVISKKENTEKLISIIFKETGTLGIRVSQNSHRSAASRKFISLEIDINGKKEKITFKIGIIGNEIISSRPEYEDIKKIAIKRDISLNEVSEIANFKIKEYLFLKNKI